MNLALKPVNWKEKGRTLVGGEVLWPVSRVTASLCHLQNEFGKEVSKGDGELGFLTALGLQSTAPFCLAFPV